MVEWYTKNADTFFAGDRDALDRVMYKNAEALLPM